MSSKQDRTATRTATDLERKYNFGETFAEFAGLASEAQKAAEEAQKAAEEANKAFEGLDQDAIFNLLTNNGEIKGIYRHDGQIYINANYLATGIIKSENGKLVIDLSGETEPTFNTGVSTNGLTIRADDAGVSGFTYIYAIELKGTDGYVYHEPVLEMYRMDESLLFTVYSDGERSHCWMPSKTNNRQVRITVDDTNKSGIELINTAGKDAAFVIDEDNYTHLTIDKINGKTVYWKDNGDGTYSLIGQ